MGYLKKLPITHFLKASKEVIELSNEVTKDNFKNKELAMKLCKRIR